MNEIIPWLVQLPHSVKGAVHPDENGDYIVFINSRYNDEQCREIFRHEVRHILLNHFAGLQPIEEAEREASDDSALHGEIERAARYGLRVPSWPQTGPETGQKGAQTGPETGEKEAQKGPEDDPDSGPLMRQLESIRAELEAEMAALQDRAAEA